MALMSLQVALLLLPSPWRTSEERAETVQESVSNQQILLLHPGYGALTVLGTQTERVVLSPASVLVSLI